MGLLGWSVHQSRDQGGMAISFAYAGHANSNGTLNHNSGPGLGVPFHSSDGTAQVCCVDGLILLEDGWNGDENMAGLADILCIRGELDWDTSELLRNFRQSSLAQVERNDIVVLRKTLDEVCADVTDTDDSNYGFGLNSAQFLLFIVLHETLRHPYW
jgi:hypothetical protein